VRRKCVFFHRVLKIEAFRNEDFAQFKISLRQALLKLTLIGSARIGCDLSEELAPLEKLNAPYSVLRTGNRYEFAAQERRLAEG
jgi:hypothetical protein